MTGDSESPDALVHDYHSLVYELNRRYRIDKKCKLETRGVTAHPAGLAMAFPLNTDMPIPFSKAILSLRARDAVNDILRCAVLLIDRAVHVDKFRPCWLTGHGCS